MQILIQICLEFHFSGEFMILIFDSWHDNLLKYSLEIPFHVCVIISDGIEILSLVYLQICGADVIKTCIRGLMNFHIRLVMNQFRNYTFVTSFSKLCLNFLDIFCSMYFSHRHSDIFFNLDIVLSLFGRSIPKILINTCVLFGKLEF